MYPMEFEKILSSNIFFFFFTNGGVIAAFQIPLFYFFLFLLFLSLNFFFFVFISRVKYDPYKLECRKNSCVESYSAIAFFRDVVSRLALLKNRFPLQWDISGGGKREL